MTKITHDTNTAEAGSSSDTTDQSQKMDLHSLVLDIETKAIIYQDKLTSTLQFKNGKDQVITSAVYLAPLLIVNSILNYARNIDKPAMSTLERVQPTNPLQILIISVFLLQFSYHVVRMIPTISHPPSSTDELKTTYQDVMNAIQHFREEYNAHRIDTKTQESEMDVSIHKTITHFLRLTPYSPSIAIGSNLNVSDEFFTTLKKVKQDLSKPLDSSSLLDADKNPTEFDHQTSSPRL